MKAFLRANISVTRVIILGTDNLFAESLIKPVVSDVFQPSYTAQHKGLVAEKTDASFYNGVLASVECWFGGKALQALPVNHYQGNLRNRELDEIQPLSIPEMSGAAEME